MGNKIYYECPGCGQEVWAYPGFVGTRCWECPGTILSGVTNAVPGISHVKTVCEVIADNRTRYKCPGCGDHAWAYGQYAGQKCWDCKRKNPVGAVFDIAGATQCPVGYELEKTVIKSTNVFEFINEHAAGISGDGGHHIDNIKGSSLSGKKLVEVWVRKSDLLWTGLNTAASVFRLVLAPVSTIDSTSFWTEHWWAVFKLDNGSYVVTFKQKWGIYAYYTSSWSTANSVEYNGMGSKVKNKNVKTVYNFERTASNSKTVGNLVDKIENMDSYYHLGTSNCQDYAYALWKWY